MDKRKIKANPGFKAKVPKTKGFDFPLYPSVRHPQSTSPAGNFSDGESSQYQAGNTTRMSSTSSSNQSPTNSNHSAASKLTNGNESENKMNSSSSMKVFVSDGGNESVSSDEELVHNQFLSRQRKLLAQTHLVEVDRTDASTQYEKKHSRSSHISHTGKKTGKRVKEKLTSATSSFVEEKRSGCSKSSTHSRTRGRSPSTFS